jgi:hypothetical protein
VDYPDRYQVDGQEIDLLLQNIKPNTTCKGADTTSTIFFPSHPTLPSTIVPGLGAQVALCKRIVVGNVTITPIASPTTVTVPYWSTDGPPLAFYHSAFPDQAAFKACSTRKKFPAQVISYLQAVQLLTETSTSYATDGGAGLTVTRNVEPKPTATANTAGLDPAQSLAPTTATPTTTGLQSQTDDAATTPAPQVGGVVGSVAASMASVLTVSPVGAMQLTDGSVLTAARNIGSSSPTSATTALGSVIPNGQSQAESSQLLQLTLDSTTIAMAPVTLAIPMVETTAFVSIPAFAIGSQTVGLGSDGAATIDGTRVALQTSSGATFAVIGDGATASTVRLSPAQNVPTITQAPIIVGGTTIPPLFPSSKPIFVVSGQTLTLGGSIIVADATSTAIVALKTDAAGNIMIVAGDKTTTLLPGSQTSPVIIAGQTIIPVLQPQPSGFILSGQTLTIGGALTIDNGVAINTLSLTTNSLDETVLIENGQTFILPSPSPPGLPLLVEGTTFSPILPTTAAVQYHISNQILILGGTITLGTGSSKTILALTTDSTGHTILLQNGIPSTLTPTSTKTNAALTIDNTTYLPLLPTGTPIYDINGKTLTFGGSVTLASGQIVTLTTGQDGRTILKSAGGVSTLGVARLSSTLTSNSTAMVDPLATAVLGQLGSSSISIGGLAGGASSTRRVGSGASSSSVWRLEWTGTILGTWTGVFGVLSILWYAISNIHR